MDNEEINYIYVICKAIVSLDNATDFNIFMVEALGSKFFDNISPSCQKAARTAFIVGKGSYEGDIPRMVRLMDTAKRYRSMSQIVGLFWFGACLIQAIKEVR